MRTLCIGTEETHQPKTGATFKEIGSKFQLIARCLPLSKMVYEIPESLKIPQDSIKFYNILYRILRDSVLDFHWPRFRDSV